MTRTLKSLGLALMAAFAMSAVAAQAASAQDLFTSTANTTALTGTGNLVWKITSPTVEISCATQKYSGTNVGKSRSEITIDGTFSGTKANPGGTKCESSLGELTLDMNGCDFDLTGSTTGNDAGLTDATTSLTCPVGKVVQTTGPLGCTLSIPAQTTTEGGVTYTTEKDPTLTDLTVHVTETGLTYTSTAACGLVGLPSHGQNCDFVGTVTLTGFEDKKELSTHVYEEGPQVSISTS